MGLLLMVVIIFGVPLYCYLMDRWGPLIFTILLGDTKNLDEDMRQSRMCDGMPPPKQPWHEDYVPPPWKDCWDHKPKDSD